MFGTLHIFLCGIYFGMDKSMARTPTKNYFNATILKI
jgi:hypothetical protein